MVNNTNNKEFLDGLKLNGFDCRNGSVSYILNGIPRCNTSYYSVYAQGKYVPSINQLLNCTKEEIEVCRFKSYNRYIEFLMEVYLRNQDYYCNIILGVLMLICILFKIKFGLAYYEFSEASDNRYLFAALETLACALKHCT